MFLYQFHILFSFIEEFPHQRTTLESLRGCTDDIHEQLTQEGEALVKEMNDYIKEFISTNYENVLGPSVFMMMCSTLPYPIMTPQIEDIIRTAQRKGIENIKATMAEAYAAVESALPEEYKGMVKNEDHAVRMYPFSRAGKNFK